MSFSPSLVKRHMDDVWGVPPCHTTAASRLYKQPEVAARPHTSSSLSFTLISSVIFVEDFRSMYFSNYSFFNL